MFRRSEVSSSGTQSLSEESLSSFSTTSASEDIVLEKRQVTCVVDSSDSPLISFQKIPISKKSFEELKVFARDNLGDDGSSRYFIERKKAIAFVYVTKDEVFRLDQNFFIQNSEYNDFSGGYKRFYKLIPENILSSYGKGTILHFKSHFNIPDGTIMLVQIQSSIIKASIPSPSEDHDKESGSVTGQGIHTDGASQAMLFCLERTNVDGAENSFFKDLDGKEQVEDEEILHEGDAVFFHDNKVYHYVSPASQEDISKLMRRSIMLIHSPADQYLRGDLSKDNNGGTQKASIKLREDEGEVSEEFLTTGKDTGVVLKEKKQRNCFCEIFSKLFLL
jgi:hypothetical protein